MTKQEALESLEAHRRIIKEIEDVAITVATIRKITTKQTPEAAYVGRFEIDGDNMTCEFEESLCSCCGPEYHSLTFPLSYLWTDNITEVETEAWAAHLDAEAKRTAEKEAAEKERMRNLREQTDWSSYLRLREKFKDVPTRTGE